ncbi:MAG: family 43 glycosylhydrolase [Acidimicrobiales bacterium]|nr:family 43 glycosylhydrolase [Acidimicrobiales bacterium]
MGVVRGLLAGLGGAGALALAVVAGGAGAGAGAPSAGRGLPPAVAWGPGPTPVRAAGPSRHAAAPVVAPPAAADPDAPGRILMEGEDMPNPFVLVEDRYYLYATQREHLGTILNVPVRTSIDLIRWDLVADALPEVPAWAEPGATWAPDVRHLPTGYVLWFTARLRGVQPDTKCIGVAVGAGPLGPFTARPEPIVCQRERRGSIDPRSFVAADGSLWLLWKSDDNADVAGAAHATIYSQRLAPDGLSLVGEPVRLLEADQAWEGRIVEAPQLVRVRDEHWLFYSGNWFNQPSYGIGVARCAGPVGPCTKPVDGPWLGSNGQGEGPGEASAFRDRDGTDHLLYAPWAQAYRTPTVRPAVLARLAFGPFGPYLAAGGPGA